MSQAGFRWVSATIGSDLRLRGLLGLPLRLWLRLRRLVLMASRARKQGEQGGRTECGKQLHADAFQPIPRRCDQLLRLIVDRIAEQADKAAHVRHVAIDGGGRRFNVFARRARRDRRSISSRRDSRGPLLFELGKRRAECPRCIACDPCVDRN